MPRRHAPSIVHSSSLPPIASRWTAEEGKIVLAAWRASGLGATDFAQSIGCDLQRLYWWSRRLGASSSIAVRDSRRPPALFIEAVVPKTRASYEVVTLSGRTLRVSSGFVDAEVRLLLSAVEDGE